MREGERREGRWGWAPLPHTSGAACGVEGWESSESGSVDEKKVLEHCLLRVESRLGLFRVWGNTQRCSKDAKTARTQARLAQPLTSTCSCFASRKGPNCPGRGCREIEKRNEKTGQDLATTGCCSVSVDIRRAFLNPVLQPRDPQTVRQGHR